MERVLEVMRLRLRSRLLPALGLAIGLCADRPAGAHELGLAQVAATFLADGTYRVELSADLESLPPRPGPPHRLGPLARPLAALRPADRERAASFLAELVDGASLAFDDRLERPTLEILPPRGTVVTARLAGPIPRGVGTFRWTETAAIGSYLLTLAHEGEANAVRQWVEGGRPAAPFELDARIVPPKRWAVVAGYLALGYTHILPGGLDHILFVLGIFLLAQRWRPVLAQVTAFTVAHTLTLGLAAYGAVALRPAIVEPLIALSIVYVAIENVLSPGLRPWRVAVVFAFGLLHGLGFAGALRETGLPKADFLTALLAFNAGVEAGQLTVILGAFLAVGRVWRTRPWYRQRVVVPASLAIALVGFYWAIERTLTS